MPLNERDTLTPYQLPPEARLWPELLALAKALREGKADPGSKAVEKLDKERANTRRTIESLEIAILEVEAELEQAVEEQKAGQVERVEAEIDQACVEYEAAITSLSDSRQKLAEAVSMRRFLDTFPERGWKPGSWRIWKLLATHGDPYDFGHVEEALRYDIEIVKRPPIEPQAESSGPLSEHLHEVGADGMQGFVSSRPPQLAGITWTDES